MVSILYIQMVEPGILKHVHLLFLQKKVMKRDTEGIQGKKKGDPYYYF
jgi:hypothetical protein